MNQTLRISILAMCSIAVAASAQAQELTGTLKKIKDSNTITVGHRESSIPFSYYDDKQQPVGYMMDLCAKVVDAVKAKVGAGVEVKYQAVNSSNRIPLMKNGTIDLECGSTTNSVKRQEEVAFSPTTYIAAVKLLVKTNSGIKGPEDLKGKTVVTTQGTTSGKYVRELSDNNKLDLKFILAKDHAESFQMVKSDRAVAFEMDDVLLYGLRATAENPADFVVLPKAFSTEPYGIMIRKDDAQFKDLVHVTIGGVMKSGEGEKIYNKWFLNAIPPKGVNLNIPMSPELKEAFANPNDKGI
jgi:glutamate/aspartate transport system substrate-binding protein